MFCILYSNRNVFANCNLKKNKNFESNWYFEKKTSTLILHMYSLSLLKLIICEI